MNINETKIKLIKLEMPELMMHVLILEIWELGYILRQINDLQVLYSENDFWAPDGDRTRNFLMTGETLGSNHWATETQMASQGASST